MTMKAISVGIIVLDYLYQELGKNDSFQTTTTTTITMSCIFNSSPILGLNYILCQHGK